MNLQNDAYITKFACLTIIFALVGAFIGWLLWLGRIIFGVFLSWIIFILLLLSTATIILKIFFFKKPLYYLKKYIAILLGNALIFFLFFPPPDLPIIYTPLLSKPFYSQTLFEFYFDGNIKRIHDPFNKLTFFFGYLPASDEVIDGTRIIKSKFHGAVLASWIDSIRVRSKSSTIGGYLGISLSARDIWIEESGRIKFDRSML
jgi:hypothetical protein